MIFDIKGCLDTQSIRKRNMGWWCLVRNKNHTPAVLAHAETLLAEEAEEFGAEVPLINRKAIEYFTERKYWIDSFTILFMSNEPFGMFENYLCFSPVFFM